MLSNGSTIAISLTFAAISTLVVLARLSTRFAIVHNPGPDDFIIVVSWALALTFSILIPIQVKYGLGQHASELTPDQYRDYLKPFWASVIVYTLSLNFTKMSILQQYLRFIVNKSLRRTCWTLMWIIVVYATAAMFLNMFTCYPIPYFWNKVVDKEGGHCLNELGLWFANASFNIISDIVIFLLPMHSLYSIHLPNRQKLGLMLVFAMGFFVCCVSIIRLESLYHVSNSPDVTYTNVGAATWSTVESQLAIICASLPALRPLVSKHNSASALSRSLGSGGPAHARDGYNNFTTEATWSGYPLNSVQQGRLHDEEDPNGSVGDGRIKVLTVLAQETDLQRDNSSHENILPK